MPARAALPASCLSRQAGRQARRQGPRDRRAASTGPPMCRCRRPPWARLRPPAGRRILSAPGPKLINAQAAGARDTANLPPHRLIGRPPVPGRVGLPPGIGRGGRCAFPAQARPTGPCRAPRRVAVCHDMLVQDARAVACVFVARFVHRPSFQVGAVLIWLECAGACMCAVNPAGYLATVARLLGEAESRNPGGATKRDAKQIYVEGYQRPFLLICMLPSPRLAAPPSRDHAGRRRDASMESRFRNLLLLTKNDERTLVARLQLAGVLLLSRFARSASAPITTGRCYKQTLARPPTTSPGLFLFSPKEENNRFGIGR